MTTPADIAPVAVDRVFRAGETLERWEFPVVDADGAPYDLTDTAWEFVIFDPADPDAPAVARWTRAGGEILVNDLAGLASPGGVTREASAAVAPGPWAFEFAALFPESEDPEAFHVLWAGRCTVLPKRTTT